MSWQTVTLGDIATFSNGINFDKRAYTSGVKFIGVSNFGDRFKPDYSELSEVKKEVVRKSDYLADGDIVFVRSNGNKALVGRCMLVQNAPEPVTFSGFCIRCHITDTTLFDPVFMTYHFKSAMFRQAMSGTAVGANIQNLSQGRMTAYTAKIPDIETQRRIASILFAYDDLIENNQKQIKLLEEAAQRLYKEWFVDLRFPGWETAEIVDGVPVGWRIDNIANVCTRINAGGTPSRRNKAYWENARINWYKTGELQDCWLIEAEEKISQEGLNNSSAKIFPANAIIMAIYASPTLGRLGIISSESATNQAALCLIADERIISWQWLYHKLYELRDEFNAIAKGAGQQNISAEVVKKKEIVIAPKQIIDSFTSLVEPLFEMRLKSQIQNQKLTEARDRLLPKLMSGEIEV